MAEWREETATGDRIDQTPLGLTAEERLKRIPSPSLPFSQFLSCSIPSLLISPQAGLLCKLDSRCSVLAATNPKEEGNSEDAVEFIGLASPLLSRFDLVLVLKDAKNPEWDR